MRDYTRGRPDAAILEIPLGGEGQPVTGVSAANQLGIGFGARALQVSLDDADSLWVANLRKGSDTFVTYSKNLKMLNKRAGLKI